MATRDDKSDMSIKSPSQDNTFIQPATPTTRYSCTSPTSVDSHQHDGFAHVESEASVRSIATIKPRIVNNTSPNNCTVSESSTTNCSRSQMVQVSPCSRCIDLARLFFDSIHNGSMAPFETPPWARKQQPFEAVILSTISHAPNGGDDNADTHGLWDALIFAAGGCFSTVDATVDADTTKTCCNFPLIRTMLSLPATTSMRKRVRNLLLELVSRTSEFSDKLALRESSSGIVLLDYIYNSLHVFFAFHLVEKNSDSAHKQRHGYSRPGNKNETSVESRSVTATRSEERNDAVLCFQILTNLARQERNHNLLLGHGSLMRICIMIASHPLVDAHVLSVSFLFMSLICTTGDFIPNGAMRAVPRNRLIESVLSVMELFTDGLISCLVCPMYVPETPNKQFLASVCRIGLAFAQHATDYRTNENIHRLLHVVVTALLNESATLFDMAHMADIAHVLAYRNPPYVISKDRRFVTALLCMIQHVWAGQVARQSLRRLVQAFPDVRLCDGDVINLLNETKHLDVNDHIVLSCTE